MVKKETLNTGTGNLASMMSSEKERVEQGWVVQTCRASRTCCCQCQCRKVTRKEVNRNSMIQNLVTVMLIRL